MMSPAMFATGGFVPDDAARDAFIFDKAMKAFRLCYDPWRKASNSLTHFEESDRDGVLTANLRNHRLEANQWPEVPIQQQLIISTLKNRSTGRKPSSPSKHTAPPS